MIIIDTETTGLLAPEPANLDQQPHMIEFAAIKINRKWEVVDTYETLINPKMELPEFITKLTGINQKDVDLAPTFIEVYEEIAKFFHSQFTCCGHNIMFDMNILINELRRHDLQYKFPYPMHYVCTIERSLPKTKKRLKQTELYKLATGKELKNAHRAMNDIMANFEIFKWLYKKNLIPKKVKKIEEMK